MYKLKLNSFGETIILKDNQNGSFTSFGEWKENTDYQNFKKQINADEAQLEDADGNLMTDAKAYVASLP